MSFDSSSRILLTGGTGSFGKAFIAETLRRYPDIQRLVVYSRDELKQWELQQIYPPDRFPQLRSRAISWFFEQVEQGIILEDDCVPHPNAYL